MRRLLALIRGLPPDAAVWRQDPSWTVRDELAAQTVEVVDFWGRLHALALGVKRTALPKPVDLQHPARQDRPKAPVTTDPARITAWLTKHRLRKE